MGPKIDVMEREWKNFNFWSASKQGPSGVWNYYWYISNNILLAKFRSTVRKLQIQNTPTVVLHRYHKSISPTPRKTRKYPRFELCDPRPRATQIFIPGPHRSTIPLCPCEFCARPPSSTGEQGGKGSQTFCGFSLFNVSQNAVRAKQQKAQDATIYANRFT
jgi:hypothetical protein